MFVIIVIFLRHLVKKILIIDKNYEAIKNRERTTKHRDRIRKPDSSGWLAIPISLSMQRRRTLLCAGARGWPGWLCNGSWDPRLFWSPPQLMPPAGSCDVCWIWHSNSIQSLHKLMDTHGRCPTFTPRDMDQMDRIARIWKQQIHWTCWQVPSQFRIMVWMKHMACLVLQKCMPTYVKKMPLEAMIWCKLFFWTWFGVKWFKLPQYDCYFEFVFFLIKC